MQDETRPKDADELKLVEATNSESENKGPEAELINAVDLSDNDDEETGNFVDNIYDSTQSLFKSLLLLLNQTTQVIIQKEKRREIERLLNLTSIRRYIHQFEGNDPV